MVFHVRRMPVLSERNPGLREGSLELCSRGGLLVMHLKVL